MHWHVGKKTKKGWPVRRAGSHGAVTYAKSKHKAMAMAKHRTQQTWELFGPSSEFGRDHIS